MVWRMVWKAVVGGRRDGYDILYVDLWVGHWTLESSLQRTHHCEVGGCVTLCVTSRSSRFTESLQ
jgi:hypothetical protein